MPKTLAAVNLNRLVVFAAVVESGSLTAAAARLGIATTMVSRHIQSLERKLGVTLLVRTTRRQRLTDSGGPFYNAIRLVLRDTEDVIDALSRNAMEPCGKLRVAAQIDYGASVLTPLLVDLHRRHPAINIELLTTDRDLDIVTGALTWPSDFADQRIPICTPLGSEPSPNGSSRVSR
jgi:DNA-binding transcriptional LysR family regulator